MKLLVDCTNAKLIFVLWPDNDYQIIDTFFIDNYRAHSENLLTHLTTFLAKNNCNLHTINKLYCCNGPGTFSGIRINLTFAKMLVLAKPDLKVLILPSLYLFHDFSNKNLLINFITDNQIYVVFANRDVISNDYTLTNSIDLKQKILKQSDYNLIYCYQSIDQVTANFHKKITKFTYYQDLNKIKLNYPLVNV